MPWIAWPWLWASNLPNTFRTARLPEEAREFIAVFDETCPHGEDCEDVDCNLNHVERPDPFAFDLEMPDLPAGDAA